MTHQHPAILSLTIEGDYEAGTKYIGAAQKVVDQLQQRLVLGGIPSGADYKDLGDGAWLYARVAMGVNAVRIVVPPREVAPWRTVIEDESPPDFLSGVVSRGWIIEKNVAGPPARTIQVLKDYLPTEASQRKHGLRPGWQENERLAVQDDPLLSVQAPAFLSDELRSQHHGIKPSMYSGTMKKVVQLLLGYGRQNAELYRYELWNVDVPLSQLSQRARVEVADRVRYDFRAYRTHGIAFDDQGSPWLVEVSAHNGVVGMPLELHPDTVREDFVRYLEDQGDSEALKVIEVLGGFPTGRTFPSSSAAMTALISSGAAVRMASAADLQPFYNNYPYSSAMGWAFNESGTEAHNTCWNWDESDHQFGEHYCLSFRIGRPTTVNPAPRAAELSALISRVDRSGWPSGEHEAFRYYLKKIGRLADWQVDSMVRMPADKAYQALKEAEVPPVAPASVRLTRVSRGALINEGYETEYQAKFWEPLMDNAIISHDFRSLSEIEERSPRGPSPQVANTTMLAFFAGNDLKTVKWFLDTRRREVNTVTSDEEECMYVGQWEHVVQSGTIGPAPGYYSSDYDYRTEHPDTVYRRTTKGEDLGWIACEANWPNDWPVGGYCEGWRVRGFRRMVEQRNSIQRESVCAMVWPAFAREAYYIVERMREITEGHSVRYEYRTLTDPNRAILWIDHYGFSSGYLRTHPKNCSNPNGRRVVEFEASKSPGCSEMVDEGPWANECDQIDGFLYNTPLPPLPPGTSIDRTLKVTYRGHFVSGYADPVDLDTESDAWFEPSPPLEFPEAYQFMYATGNCFGDQDCVVYSVAPSAGLAKAGAFEADRLTDGLPCFIGVV